MNYGEYTLPQRLIEMAVAGKFDRAQGCWELKQEVDAYGNHLETELAEVYADQEAIQKATAELPQHYTPDGGDYGELDEQRLREPGFIPDIVDFKGIVCFGISADGAPFCFDFRDDPERPSVIWWDDWYWRRIAPDFDSFVKLFDLTH